MLSAKIRTKWIIGRTKWILGFFPNIALVEFRTKWIRIKWGPGVLWNQAWRNIWGQWGHILSVLVCPFGMLCWYVHLIIYQPYYDSYGLIFFCFAFSTNLRFNPHQRNFHSWMMKLTKTPILTNFSNVIF